MPDYSHWLTPARLAETELEWAKMDRSHLCRKIMENNPDTVIEFCCGTGWIPKGLPAEVHYNGLDANPGCIKLATEKNYDDRCFRTIDVRDYKVQEDPYDMALAFSCLKHFSLAEWDGFYSKVLQSGKRTLTSIFMHPHDREDEHHGFPHTAVSLERVERVIKENGHRLVQVFTLPPLNKDPEPLVLTERIDDGAGLVSPEGLREGGDAGELPIRGELLEGVPGEAGDPGGEDPDADQGGDGEGPRRGKEWPL